MMNYLECNAAFIILRCDAYLRSQGYEGSLKEYPQLIAASSKRDDEAFKSWADAEKMLALKKTSFADIMQKRYSRLLDLLGGDNVVRTCLDLTIAEFYNPEFSDYLKEFFNCDICLKLAFLLEGIPFADEKEILKRAADLSLYLNLDIAASPVQMQKIRIDDRTMGYLYGSDELSHKTSLYCEHYKPDEQINDPYIYENVIERGIAFFKKGGQGLQISGHGGRRFIVRQIFKSLDESVLLINLEDLVAYTGKNFIELRNEIIREAVYQGSGICIYGITEKILGDGDRHRIEIMKRDLLSHILRRGIRLCLLSDISFEFFDIRKRDGFLSMELKETLTYDDRKKIWEGFVRDYKLGIDPAQAAIRYHLDASEMSRMVSALMDHDSKDDSDRDHMLSRLSLSAAGLQNSQKLGRILYPRTRLSDVKLKPELKAGIVNIVNSARVAGKVFDEWGLNESYQYGTAVSILLSGPPGTGKTMTANAIAGELAIPLYQINLSNVVDKYIGETEKNLEKVFSFAEKTNVVLFFDEADSVFGKRSEVNKAQDKYANNETSYLLQRIESYKGIVVMATNIRGNIDQAFMRRIRYVLQYDNPDADVRRQIWESLITDRLPHEEIDIDYLAEQFDGFTGSVIKTVFLNACTSAASEEKPLSMRHLVSAIRGELQKSSTVTFSVDALGKYAHY